ncbi:hypothetical protein M8Z33_13335 [Streptomyces sp. ZAF1911]|uniref:hypothetical protein n=1 Tax=Streptomyces sp. ZAF1911 TaxID=2944129 RepID=UPI00237C37B5|nr:hypothetical protein [Streptomyces sp. ZAF1911]MDD9377623.1 hypothetical protein [Streptomyces sp. ZAF1911]
MLRIRLAQAAAVTALTSSFLLADALLASAATAPQAPQTTVSVSAAQAVTAGTAPAAGKDTMGWS